MPGVPGQLSGKPPKRSDQRRRQNKVSPPVEKAIGAENVPIPPVDKDWHPLVQALYESLPDSGQSQFFQPSDWAVAQVVCESLSRELRPMIVTDQDGHAILGNDGRPMTRKLPLRGSSLSAYLRAFQGLLLIEGDRRRLRLELERRQPGGDKSHAPGVPNLDDYRARLAAG
jgi:hypothetical protein